MTPEQELHLQSIKDSFVRDVDKKYRAGQKENGGNLFDMSILQLIENGMQEAIDSYVYLKTAKDEINKIIKDEDL